MATLFEELDEIAAKQAPQKPAPSLFEELDAIARQRPQPKSEGLTLREGLRAAGQGIQEAYGPAVQRIMAPSQMVEEQEAEANRQNLPEALATTIEQGAGPLAFGLSVGSGYGIPAAGGMTLASAALGREVAHQIRGTAHDPLEPLAYGGIQALATTMPGAGRLTTAALAARAPAAAMAAELGAGVAAGAATGIGLDALYQASTTGKIDWKQAAKMGGITALIGGIGGGIRAAQVGRLAATDRAGLVQLARSQGYKGTDFDGLESWYNEQAAVKQAKAAAERAAGPVYPPVKVTLFQELDEIAAQQAVKPVNPSPGAPEAPLTDVPIPKPPITIADAVPQPLPVAPSTTAGPAPVTTPAQSAGPVTPAVVPAQPPIAPAPQEPSATTEPTAGPVPPLEEIGDRPGASVSDRVEATRAKLRELERQAQAASNVYKQILATSPQGKTLWHEQLREQIENPSRYHKVYEDENPKGLKIGDEVIVNHTFRGKPDPIKGFVTSIEKTKATAYEGGYSVNVAMPEVGKYGGWHGIDLVEKVGAPEPKAAETKNSQIPAEAPAPVQTPAGPEVAPTQAQDRKVSQLVDRKQFKVQREFLMDAVNKALAEAPEMAKDHLTIEVPGDGTFTILNNKERLRAFRGAVEDRFGKSWQISLAGPGVQLGKGKKTGTVANPFAGAGEPSTPSTDAKPIPALNQKTNADSVNKAAQLAASQDETRFVLTAPVKEGAFTVATDGRRLFVATNGGGSILDKARQFKAAGQTEKSTYPNWLQVLPKDRVTIGKTGFKPKGKPQITADADEVLRVLNRVQHLLPDKFMSINLHDVGGKLGISFRNPAVGDFRSDGVPPSSPAFMAIDPDFLRDLMTQARMLGENRVRLSYVPDAAEGSNPLLAFIGDKAVSVIMNVRAGTPISPRGDMFADDAAAKAGADGKPMAPVIAKPEQKISWMHGKRPVEEPPAEAPAPAPAAAPPAAAVKEDQMDLLQDPSGRAPILARINQKITELEKQKAKVEEDEAFPPAVIKEYQRLADDANRRLDAARDRIDVLEKKKELTDAEDEELFVLRKVEDQLYDIKERAEGDLAAVEKYPLTDGIELLDSQIETWLKRKAQVEAIRVKAAMAGKMDDVPAGFTPHGNGRAAASPGMTAAWPDHTKYPPNPEPVDDPNFSQLPIQLPELVEFYKMVSGGKLPKIVEKIQALGGRALGVFRYQEGKLGSGRIELRADLFHLLSAAEKRKLMDDAVNWARAMKEHNPGLNFHDAVRQKFHDLVRAAEEAAMKRDPVHALHVFAHEIWHYLDFLPDGTLRRGNILGHMAALKRYLQEYIQYHPGLMGESETHDFPTAGEKSKLRARAEKELLDQVKTIIETIRREEPIYETLPLTPDMITGIVKNTVRDEFPQFYDWFAKQDRATKADVLRKAMKGVVDERAKQFAQRKQTGTRVVEEQVERMTGTPPTPENIAKRYEELLREELKFRGLISEKDIRRELEGAIAWWHGTQTIPPYFTTPVEMFAEAGSIFMNNPAALRKRAPTFFRSLMAYMDRRPAVKQAYEDIQSDIRNGQVQGQRVGRLRAGWRDDEALALKKDAAESRLDKRQLIDAVNLAFNRHQYPIQRLAQQHIGEASADKVLSALKDYLYRQTAVEGLARQVNLRVEKPLAENNLTHEDLSEYMFHKRITAGDAIQTANSQGWSVKTSNQRLAEMEAQMTPRQWQALQQATGQMRSIYEQGTVRLLEESQALSPKLMAFIKQNIHYSPFSRAREAFNPADVDTIHGMLESSYGKDITSRIFHRLGSFQDIQSPYAALLTKAEVLTRFAYRQIALNSIVKYMQEFEPDLIQQAPMHFNGHQMVPKIIQDEKIGTLLPMHHGVVQGFYVPRAIWETMEQASGLEQVVVSFAIRAISPFKSVLTELNPGFWPVAFSKDLVTAAVQMPRGIRSLRNLPAAFRGARATFSGKPDPVADAILNRLMVVSRADPRGEHVGVDPAKGGKVMDMLKKLHLVSEGHDQTTRWLLRMSKHPEIWEAEGHKIGAALRFWEAWKRQGQILERTVKGMGMLELDRSFGAPAPSPDIPWVAMPEWRKKQMVNEYSGSPDFNERGRAVSIVEVFGGPMFINAWMRGIESFYKAQKEGRSSGGSPGATWMKFAGLIAIPAAALLMFELGLSDFGADKQWAEDMRLKYRSIPERDKARGYVIPLAWADFDNRKVVYAVLPFPDQLRSLHASWRKLLQTMFGAGGGKGVGADSIVQYHGQDLPGKNPVISEVEKWWEFAVQGRNPYDPFRGRPALNEDVFTAGQGAGELAKQSASALGGGILYRNIQDMPGENKTQIEKFLQAPVISNILGRWIKVSNAGVHEENMRALEPSQEKRAQLRIVAEELLRKNLANEPWTESEVLVKSVEPYVDAYMQDRMASWRAQASGPEARDWQRANKEERLVLEKLWADRAKQREERLAR